MWKKCYGIKVLNITLPLRSVNYFYITAHCEVFPYIMHRNENVLQANPVYLLVLHVLFVIHIPVIHRHIFIVYTKRERFLLFQKTTKKSMTFLFWLYKNAVTCEWYRL